MKQTPSQRARTTLAVGDTGALTKTITEDDVLRFAAASGDFNPVHIDEAYAQTTRFGHRIAHGVLTAGIISSVLGGDIPGLGTIFTELHIRFLLPVYLGDTITATAIVSNIVHEKRVSLVVAGVNQHRKDVALGHAIVIPPEGTTVIA
jgi:3-hydroxybutyryl-CoA dehydratase